MVVLVLVLVLVLGVLVLVLVLVDRGREGVVGVAVHKTTSLPVLEALLYILAFVSCHSCPTFSCFRSYTSRIARQIFLVYFPRLFQKKNLCALLPPSFTCPPTHRERRSKDASLYVCTHFR